MTKAGVVHRHLVLLSGGIDSACLIAESLARGARPSALFIDYGQPVAARERECSEALADYFAVDWSGVRVEGIGVPSGEIAGRNALLAHLALTWLGQGEVASVYLGIHAGTTYRDCSPEFLEETQRSLDFQSGGTVRIVGPYVNWPKLLVLRRAIELEVPIELTHSCERSSVPCGVCLSCVDRSELLARA
jgi:7-cyano-7-deazaguanine synthase